MADRLNCVVQAGHVPRTRGATGANGLLGTEQQFTLKTATYIQKWLTLRGWTCEMIGADDDVPDSTVFVAIHHDGSRNKDARGPSVGYPADHNDGSKNAAQEWKRVYGAAYPGPSFRPDNYTGGLRGYYAFRKSTARIKLCCEHGFGSNAQDAAFMWSDAGQKAALDAVEAVLGHWLGWDARLSPQEVHARLNPGAQPAPRTAAEAPSHPTLRDGDHRPAVITLQRALAAAGYDPGPIDGAFGPLTEAAVRNFQSAHGLTVDGIAGPQTWAELTRVPADEIVPGAKPSPPAPVMAEPPGRQVPEAEPPSQTTPQNDPPIVHEEMPVSELKNKAGHTAWQASAAALVVTILHGLGIETDLPDEAEIAAAVGIVATLASAVKTWWQEDRLGGGKHTS